MFLLVQNDADYQKPIYEFTIRIRMVLGKNICMLMNFTELDHNSKRSFEREWVRKSRTKSSHVSLQTARNFRENISQIY